VTPAAELDPSRIARDWTVHGNDQLVGLECGLVQAAEEVVGRDLAGSFRWLHRGRVPRRDNTRGVVIGEAAADGPARAHRRITDAVRKARERSDACSHLGGRGNGSVRSHRADAHRRCVGGNAGEVAHAPEVDQFRGRSETEFHRRREETDRRRENARLQRRAVA